LLAKVGDGQLDVHLP